MFVVLYTHGHFLVQLFSQVFHSQKTGNVSVSQFGDTYQMAMKKINMLKCCFFWCFMINTYHGLIVHANEIR